MSTTLEGAMSETESIVRALMGQVVGEAEALVRKHPEDVEKGGPITPQLDGDGREVAEGESEKVRATGDAAKKSILGDEDAERAEVENRQSSVLRQSLLDISTINAQLINAGPAKILEIMQTPIQQGRV